MTMRTDETGRQADVAVATATQPATHRPDKNASKDEIAHVEEYRDRSVSLGEVGGHLHLPRVKTVVPSSEADLLAFVKDHHALALRSRAMFCIYAWMIGVALRKLKSMIPHGNSGADDAGWGHYLRKTLEMPRSTADRYIALATKYPNGEELKGMAIGRALQGHPCPAIIREKRKNAGAGHGGSAVTPESATSTISADGVTCGSDSTVLPLVREFEDAVLSLVEATTDAKNLFSSVLTLNTTDSTAVLDTARKQCNALMDVQADVEHLVIGVNKVISEHEHELITSHDAV